MSGSDIDPIEEYFDGDIPECDQCGHELGRNGNCLQCLFTFESIGETIDHPTLSDSYRQDRDDRGK